MIGAGTVLAGRYQLEGRIASGGMGDVWRGVDRVLGRTVAVKCLRGASSEEPDFVDRLRAEARTMATVSHPGVVEVYDLGDAPGVGVYLVMKYIEGESLAQVLARDGRLSVTATMRLVADAAEALQAAHEKGVTHRDVKPGNLLIRPDGSAVLTDFGIARSAGATRHTDAGSLLGTAGYIAPEQANGQPATPRSDIYSLGVVAYRCLAGHPPFAGDSFVELALRHARDEPPPLPSHIPPGVRAVVERAMAKHPAARWPTGAALAAEARRALAAASKQRQTAAATPTLAQPAPSGSGRSRLLAGGAVALVIAAVAAVVLIIGRGGESPSPTATANPSPSNPVAVIGGTNQTSAPSATSTAGPSGSTPSGDPRGGGPSAGAGSAALGAPTKLTATPIGPNTIRLQWTDNSSGEDGFTIHNGVTAKDVGANRTTYDWTGLLAATHSCFKVRAFNSSGVSPYYPTAQTDWVCATSLSGVGPAAPSDLTATPVESGTIRLQWVDNSGDEEGFTVYNGQTWRNVGANTTTFNWDGLAPGTYMCFKVRSYRLSGVSAYSPTPDAEWVCTTTPTT